jgi:general secretion pathway protein N
MKHRKLHFGIFAATFVAALAALAPATLMNTWAARFSDGRLVLAGASGTLWHGTATPVLQLKDAPPLRLGSMAWQVSLRPLWRGQFLLRVTDQAAPQQALAEIYVGLRRIELRNVHLDLPAAAMGGLNPLLQAMRLQGRLAVSANSLVLARNGAITGAADATWQTAGSALSPVNPFGNYRLDVNGAGDTVKIALATLSGDLQLNGQGAWHAGALAFQATASANGPRKDAFAEMLHHLGPETSPGVFSFSLGR